LDASVRYVSFYAAEAFCHSRGKQVPRLQYYRTAANLPASEDLTFRYETAYQAPDFHFVPMEWTVGRWEEGPDPGTRIPYHYGMAHRGAPRDPNYTPALEKRYTGSTLGFRCAAAFGSADH
jgi:hypothetical protein